MFVLGVDVDGSRCNIVRDRYVVFYNDISYRRY